MTGHRRRITMPTRFPIFIIDASSYVSKVYYQPHAKTPGENIKNFTVYSFCRMLENLAKKFNFAHIVIVWDGYKEARFSANLLAQKKLIMEFIDLIRMEQILENNISSYDIIFAMTKSFNNQHHDVVIVTHNINVYTLISDATIIFDPFTKKSFTKENFEKKFKFSCSKFPLYLALAGTANNHIPGVYGIGKKRAMQYAQRFHDLDDLYQHIDKISGAKTKAALREGKQNAYESLKLATPHHQLNPTTVARTNFPEKNWNLAIPFFEKYHYKKLIRTITQQTTTELTTLQTIKNIEQTYFHLSIIQTKNQLQMLAQSIYHAKILSIQIQGSCSNPMAGKPDNISIAIDKETVYYIPLHNAGTTNLVTEQELITILGPIFADQNIDKIINNPQYSLVMALQLTIPIHGKIFDITNAASFALHDFEQGGLEQLQKFYLQQAHASYQHTQTQTYLQSSECAINQDNWHAISDVHQSFILHQPLQLQLEKENVVDNFTTIEMPITKILAAMQYKGIWCHALILKQLDAKLSDELIKITEEIHAYCPESINLNSTAQLRKLLFETLNLPSYKKLRKKRESTDSATLQDLSHVHPVPALILKYRQVHKYQRPYVEGILHSINPITQKIHPCWSLSLGKTGRISAAHPQIQSVPTDDLGYGIATRSAFQTDSDHTFLSVAYDELELHVIAHVSHDKMLKAALLSATDIHAKTAARLFGIPQDQVNAKQRSIAKKINLSIAYGISAYGLSKDQNIPYHQATLAMRNFFSQYAGVRAWIHKVIEHAKQQGYVTTLFGRKRYLPNIYSKNRIAYDAAARLALTTIIQGTASEIVKMSIIKLTQAFHQRNIHASILLLIHDQFVIEVSNADREQAKKIVQDTCRSIVTWEIELTITIAAGGTWQQATIQEEI